MSDRAGARRVRVCYVVSYFHPFASGAERQALEQGRELARRGHEVHVVTRAVPGYPIEDEEVDGIFIHRWIKVWNRGPLFALSFVAGVIAALYRLRSSIDVVHTHQGLWEGVATGLARPCLPGKPTLIQPASSGFYGEADELGRTRGAALLRRLILNNTAFAAISADIERQWSGLGVARNRIFRTVSGVDTSHFHPGPSLVEDSLLPHPRVVFTGRLHPQKNLPLLIDAWPEIAGRTSANLIVVGPGDSSPLREQAQKLGVSDHVQFVGAVADPAEHLRAADLFALPSVAEGMSNSLLEAMATGLTCVVSGIGGNTDLVRDGQTGRLVADATPAAWSQALIELIEAPEMARRLGDRAQARIEAEFALPRVVDRYLEIYRLIRSDDWPDTTDSAVSGDPRRT
jgi:glycosyltransferase involved in cell wall biosynthesis